jgi:YbbR domain-containing protein
LTNNWPAKVLSIVAAALLFLFYRISTLQERFISVPLQVVTNEAFVPTSRIPDSVRVTLRGKANTIFLVHQEDIGAFIDLSLYKNAGVYRVPVKVSRKGATANTDFEIKVDPLELTVTLEKKMTKTVSVTGNIRGFPAKGYELAQYFLSPDHVQIVGPKSRVKGVDSLKTDPIDLNGKAQDFTERVGVAVSDPTVKVLGNEMVQFHGIIRKVIVVRTIEPIDIVALDLDPNLRMQLSATTGSIQLQGSQLALENLRQGDATLDVECSQIKGPGVYTLPTRPSVPVGFVVLSYTPERVTLTISKGNSGQ